MTSEPVRDADYVATVGDAIMDRATVEGLWDMPLADIDVEAMAEEIVGRIRETGAMNDDDALEPILRAARRSVEYHDSPWREYPGYIWIEWEDLVRFVRAHSPRSVECPWCRGVGRVNSEPCHPCREDGTIAEGDDHWDAANALIDGCPQRENG